MSEYDDHGEPEGRMPPHDAIAEQSVLGGMLTVARVVGEVTAIVQAQDFYKPNHELIFTAIVALAGRGEPADPVTVAGELDRVGMLARAGGPAYIWQLTNDLATAANAEFHAEIVRQKAIRRRLIEAGVRIQQMGYQAERDPGEIADTARHELEAAARNTSTELHSIGAVWARVVDDLAQTPTFVESPWREINEIIGGFRRGALYVLGARPGEGKTIMGLQAAQALAQSGPVAFSSLEMSQEELLKRLIAMRGKVHLGPISKHNLSSEDWEKVAQVRDAIVRLPLFIDDRSGVTITEIKAHARAAARKGQLAGVVVDYVQLITGSDKSKSRNEMVGEFSRELKILGRELDCPVLALAQLNRESVSKGRRAPTLADLRDSGSLEQDADVVLMLQRQMEEDGRPADRLNVHIAKNRHGPANVMKTLLWEGQYARVSSQSWGYTG